MKKKSIIFLYDELMSKWFVWSFANTVRIENWCTWLNIETIRAKKNIAMIQKNCSKSFWNHLINTVFGSEYCALCMLLNTHSSTIHRFGDSFRIFRIFSFQSDLCFARSLFLSQIVFLFFFFVFRLWLVAKFPNPHAIDHQIESKTIYQWIKRRQHKAPQK